MLSSVGLEVMNSTNPELNWKSVTKGRRTRKSVARSLNNGVEVGNSISPKRVGDFSGSDSDKFGEPVIGQSNSGKSESVPFKKRRHVLKSPPSHPWASALCGQDSSSQRARSSPPFSEDHEQLQYLSSSLGRRSSNWNVRRVQGSSKAGGDGFEDVSLYDQTERKYNDSGDFSGIELLAAAASMDDDVDNDSKANHQEDPSIPKNSESSSSATLLKVSLKCNESENSSSNANVPGGNIWCSHEKISVSASKSECESPEDDGTVPKVDRQHWDLNTLMDAWGEPSDDPIGRDASIDDNDKHLEGRKNDPRNQVFLDPVGTKEESSNLKIEGNKSASVSEEIICTEPSILEEHLQEPSFSIFSISAKETDHASENDLHDNNSTQFLSCDADVKNLNEVTGLNALLESSPLNKLPSTSRMLLPEEKNGCISGAVTLIQDENCSGNFSEFEKSTTLGDIDKQTNDVHTHDMTASDFVIDVQLKDTKLLPGMISRDAQPYLIGELSEQNDSSHDAKQEDGNHTNEGSKRTTTHDSSNRYNAGVLCDDPIGSYGKDGFSIDGRRDSGSQDNHVHMVGQDNHVHMVGGDDFTGIQEGYDSSYEDGELRGSFLCSWEDIEIENECVDYESDGRNEDGSDAADCPASEILEGGFEGSHCTPRSLTAKISSEVKSKSMPQSIHSPRKHFVLTDSDNNEAPGKEVNAGSCTTDEQCLEMVKEEEDGSKTRQLSGRRDAVDVEVSNIDEYASEMTSRGKLQSHIEVRSSADAIDGNDVFFMQQFSSYSWEERDMSLDRYMGRHRSNTHGERDRVNQWTSWGSRKRYTSNYQGTDGRNHTRPRSKIGESAAKIDRVNFRDSRQSADYLLRGLHRPQMRISVERDEYFVGRRMPLTRGVGGYRSRGHYSQRGGREFLEDLEPLPDDAGPSVRMPRYFSRRERSFSPVDGRGPHMTLSRRRSRSRSRSRTRSPRPWHPHRLRIMGNRRRSRSPEFRSEARMERMRPPFPKPSFVSEYGEDYMPPPSRSRVSPQRSCRWVDNRNFAETHVRRQRSPPPVRVFRQTQRFEAVGRVKSDKYLRAGSRPGRFSYVGNADGRRDEVGEVMHREDGRRFRDNAAGGGDFETS